MFIKIPKLQYNFGSFQIRQNIANSAFFVTIFPSDPALQNDDALATTM